MTNRSHQPLVLSLFGTASTPCCSTWNASNDTNSPWHRLHRKDQRVHNEECTNRLNVTGSMPLLYRNVGCIIAEMFRPTHFEASCGPPWRGRGNPDNGHFLSFPEVRIEKGSACRVIDHRNDVRRSDGNLAIPPGNQVFILKSQLVPL